MHYETYDGTGALRSATLTWIKAGNRKMKDWDNTTLGTLRVNESQLVLAKPASRDCALARRAMLVHSPRATAVSKRLSPASSVFAFAALTR
jgi:hypothetical protein